MKLAVAGKLSVSGGKLCVDIGNDLTGKRLPDGPDVAVGTRARCGDDDRVGPSRRDGAYAIGRGFDLGKTSDGPLGNLEPLWLTRERYLPKAIIFCG